MREAWKRETYVRSQSFSSESAVKYLHVGRRKIQISPPPGEQDQLNALPQGQQRQSNPHPMPCPPPASFTLIGVLVVVVLNAPTKFRDNLLKFTLYTKIMLLLLYRVNLNKLSRNFVRALRTTTTTNCRVSFIDLFSVFPRNFRIVFLPHTNTVIILEWYCDTITEPGLPVIKPANASHHKHSQMSRLSLTNKTFIACQYVNRGTHFPKSVKNGVNNI